MQKRQPQLLPFVLAGEQGVLSCRDVSLFSFILSLELLREARAVLDRVLPVFGEFDLDSGAREVLLPHEYDDPRCRKVASASRWTMACGQELMARGWSFIRRTQRLSDELLRVVADIERFERRDGHVGYGADVGVRLPSDYDLRGHEVSFLLLVNTRV